MLPATFETIENKLLRFFKRLSGSCSRDIENCWEILPVTFFFKKLSKVLPKTFLKNCREVLPATFFKKLLRSVFQNFYAPRISGKKPERSLCRYEVFRLPCHIQQQKKTDRTAGGRKKNLTLFQVASWINIKHFENYLLGKLYVMVENNRLS